MKLSALEGEALGCSPWLVNGVVKTVLSFGAQPFHYPQMNRMAWQWRLTVILMGACAAAGLTLGAMNGAIGTRGAVLSGSPKRTAWSAGPWEMYDLSSDPAE